MSTSDGVELAREWRVLAGGYPPDTRDEHGSFVVYYVYEPDGETSRDSMQLSLRAALTERDLRQKQWEEQAARNGRRATGFFGVQDESGARDGRWLDWDDLT